VPYPPYVGPTPNPSPNPGPSPSPDPNPDPDSDKDKECKTCLPCVPPVGSIAYRVDEPPSPAHNGIPTPHSHKYEMHQSPPTASKHPCRCFWHEVQSNPIPGRLSPKIQPASGGGVAP
jgi:hypothetical protein